MSRIRFLSDQYLAIIQHEAALQFFADPKAQTIFLSPEELVALTTEVAAWRALIKFEHTYDAECPGPGEWDSADPACPACQKVLDMLAPDWRSLYDEVVVQDAIIRAVQEVMAVAPNDSLTNYDWEGLERLESTAIMSCEMAYGKVLWHIKEQLRG